MGWYLTSSLAEDGGRLSFNLVQWPASEFHQSLKFQTKSWEGLTTLIFFIEPATTRWIRSTLSASVHFPQTSALDKSQQHPNNLWAIQIIEPGATRWAAQMLPLCYAAPLDDTNFEPKRFAPTSYVLLSLKDKWKACWRKAYFLIAAGMSQKCFKQVLRCLRWINKPDPQSFKAM